MADDIALKVGIDLEAFKADVKKASDILADAFKMSPHAAAGGNQGVLGAGQTPQVAGGGYGAMQETLEKILVSLNAGFTTLSEQNGAAFKANLKNDHRESHDRNRTQGPLERGVNGIAGGIHTFQSNAALNHLSHLGHAAGRAGNALADAAQAGWRAPDLWKMGSAVADAIPGMGGWSSTFETFAEIGEREERHNALRFDAWRHGGASANAQMRRAYSTDSSQHELANLGITPQAYLQWMLKGDKAGGPAGVLTEGITRAEGMFGMGDEYAGLAGAMRRSGAGSLDAKGKFTFDKDSANMFADALSVAMETGLERARWPEAVTGLMRAAQGVTSGKADYDRLLAQQHFVQGMGAQFQGDTQASRDAVAFQNRITSGQLGGASSTFAILAGLRKGQSYSESLMSMHESSSEGNNAEATLDLQMNNPAVQQYFKSGNASDLADAALAMSMINGDQSGASMPKWRDLIRRRRDVGGWGGLSEKNRDAMRGAMKSGRFQRPMTDIHGIAGDIMKMGPGDTYEFLGIKFGAGKQQGRIYDPALEATGTPPSVVGATGAISSGVTAKSGGSLGSGEFLRSDADLGSIGRVGGGANYGFNQDRAYTIENGVRNYNKPGKHQASDITPGPSGDAFFPVAGHWLGGGGLSMKDPSEGRTYRIKGDDDCVYTVSHILEVNTLLVRNKWYAAGTRIGKVVPKFKNTVGHTHWAAKKGGQRVDPVAQFGVKGLNYLRTGSGSMEEALERLKPSAAVSAPAATSDADTANPGEAATRPARRDQSSVDTTKTLNVNISVTDGRASITKVAARGQRKGQPGQMFNVKV